MGVSALRAAFEKILAEWATRRGMLEQFAHFDEDGMVSFLLGDVVGTLAYRDETDMLLLWFESGFVETPRCFRSLLPYNDRYAATRGFTLAYAPRTRRVILQDRRPVERVNSLEALEAWLKAGSSLSAVVYEAVHVGRAALPKEV